MESSSAPHDDHIVDSRETEKSEDESVVGHKEIPTIPSSLVHSLACFPFQPSAFIPVQNLPSPPPPPLLPVSSSRIKPLISNNDEQGFLTIHRPNELDIKLSSQNLKSLVRRSDSPSDEDRSRKRQRRSIVP